MKLKNKKAAAQISNPIFFAIIVGGLLLPTASLSQDEDEPIEETVEVMQANVDRLVSMVQVERGRKIYLRACAPCHGVRGDGKGPAAIGFDPAPRNFRRGTFKFRTTASGTLPLDKDLERTVREGVPGTEMPRWKKVLSKNDIKAVVQYIKTFSPSFADPDSLPLPEDMLEMPDDRPFEPSLASAAAGRLLFVEQDCVKCHGDGGKADGVQADELVDDWDVPIRPANLTHTYFKNGKRDQDIYRVFTTGLNGTPMPAFDELTEEQRWQLADYVKSLEQKKTFLNWLFDENPNQVRHPALEKAEASESDG